MPQQFPVEGGCLCGKVRYRLKASPQTVYRCHCKDCQRTSGAGYSMSAVVDAMNIELTAGELVAFEKAADSGRRILRMRCPECGTIVWSLPAAGGPLIILKPGTLDDSSWAQPVGNIWTASKASWIEIDPDDTSYPGQAVPDRAALVAAWQARGGN